MCHLSCPLIKVDQSPPQVILGHVNPGALRYLVERFVHRDFADSLGRLGWTPYQRAQQSKIGWVYTAADVFQVTV